MFRKVFDGFRSVVGSLFGAPKPTLTNIPARYTGLPDPVLPKQRTLRRKVRARAANGARLSVRYPANGSHP